MSTTAVSALDTILEVATDPTETLVRPELDEVLREVNRIRALRGGDAIYELPKGRPQQAVLCPDGPGCVLVEAFRDLGATGAHEEGVGFGSRGTERDWVYWPLPQFVRDFDEGRYPELEAWS